MHYTNLYQDAPIDFHKVYISMLVHKVYISMLGTDVMDNDLHIIFHMLHQATKLDSSHEDKPH